MEDVLIEFRGVTKRFGERTILNSVNFSIYDNQVTTIIGKSGTGKSVLLKHIMGLLEPTEGTILFRGKPTEQMDRKELDEFRSKFSYCFQNNALFDSMTVFENIALPLRQTTKLDKNEIEKRVMEKVEQVELSEVHNKYPSEISGGMQKRVALARALITDPHIVLFDEPTTGQDPVRKNAILGMIAQNQKKFGFTTIMISHEIPDVFFISDRILILYDGDIIFQGSYKELDNLDHPMVDEFVKSLEGFQDELTGLHSKKSFESAYEKRLDEKEPHEKVIAIVFSLDDIDEMNEKLGTTKTQEVLQYLGEKVNKHFGNVGISIRIGRNRIATMLTETDSQTAGQMLEVFARDIQEKGLGELEAVANTGDASKPSIFSVSAGLSEGNATEDMDALSKRARSSQKAIAGFPM